MVYSLVFLVKNDDKGQPVVIRKYMYVCVFVAKRSTLIANYVYHLISPLSRVAATSYTIVEMQLPFLVPAVRPHQVDRFRRQQQVY